MTPYSANLRFLQRRFPHLLGGIESALPSVNAVVTRARNGESSLVVTRSPAEGMGVTAIHSTYNPQREIERAIRSVAEAEVYVLFGIGLNRTAPLLLSRNPTAIVILCEESPSSFRSILEAVPLTPFPKKTIPVVGPDDLERVLADQVVPGVSPRVTSWSLRPWCDLPEHQTGFSRCRRTLTAFLENHAVNLATIERFGRIWSFSALRNLIGLARSGTTVDSDPVSLLRERIAGRRVGIAAAGPTLEDRFQQLKRCDLVIATDTAYPAVHAAGIKSSLVVTLDGQFWSHLHYRRPLDESQILIADIGAAPATTGRAPRRILGLGHHPLAFLASKVGVPGIPLETDAGNVTGAAFDIAARAGAGEIFVAGGDFAYPGGRAYARGTYLYEVAAKRSSRFFPPETFWGAFLEAPSVMDRYRVDMEERRRIFEEGDYTPFASTGTVSGTSVRRSILDFLGSHQRNLNRLLLEKERDDGTPAERIAAMGIDGRAHLPLAAWYASRGQNDPVQHTWRIISAFLERFFDRYYE